MTITKWQKQNPILYQTEIAPFKNSFHDLACAITAQTPQASYKGYDSTRKQARYYPAHGCVKHTVQLCCKYFKTRENPLGLLLVARILDLDAHCS